MAFIEYVWSMEGWSWIERGTCPDGGHMHAMSVSSEPWPTTGGASTGLSRQIDFLSNYYSDKKDKPLYGGMYE